MKPQLRRWRKALAIFLLLWPFTTILVAQPQADGELPVLTVSGEGAYPITKNIYWFQTTKSLNADAAFARFRQGDGELLWPAVGIHSTFEANYYWLTFALHNSESIPKTVYYQFNNPHLDSITVFRQTASGMELLFHTGAALPFFTRPYPFHDFVLPLVISADATERYLILAQKEGKIFSIHPQLGSTSHFRQQEQRIYITFGIFLGVMLFNVLVNIFLGISLRDKIHYLYSLYVLSSMAWLFCSIGAEFQFVFPNNPVWFSLSQSVTGAITMILMARLAFVFLQLKVVRAIGKLLLQSFTWLLALILPLKIVVERGFPEHHLLKEILLHAYLIAVAGIAVAIIWVAVMRIRQGFRPAWFYLLAMCYLACSICIACYKILKYGDLSELFSAPTHVQLGLLMETAIIFLGIIYRYNLMKKEQRKLQRQLAERELEMNRQVIAAQEEERRRVAQDLHDDVGATLSTLILHISNVPDLSEVSKENTLLHHQQSLAISKKALADLRNISHDLLPRDFENNGLFYAINERLTAIHRATSLAINFNSEGADRQLQAVQAIILYRILNELLVNIVKHAKASAVSIDLVLSQDITLIVEDNGQGFETVAQHAGIGLRNIHSRVAFLNGTVNIDSNEQGTTVIVVIPIHQPLTYG